MQHSLFILIIILSISCTDKKIKEISHNPPNSNAILPDTSISDTSATKEGLADTANILTTGIFHEGEVWPGVEKENWFGVFQDDKGYYLLSTKIKAERIFDPLSDDESNQEMTGWEINTFNEDIPVLLISGLNYLSEHRIPSTQLNSLTIFPNDTIQLNFQGKQYQLFATGKKENISPNKEQYIVSNYKLYLSRELNGKSITQLLVAHSEFDDAMTSIIFSGDIDGDDLLDLVIDLSNHYNVSNPALFLSRPATSENLVKLVGQHIRVGC